MSSVRVISPEWPAVFASLEAWAEGVMRERPEVLGVLLYGSMGRGDHAPGSDADLLVVVRESPNARAERASALPPLRLPVCHEVLVYTAEELASLLEQGLPFLWRALEEGRWLRLREGWQPLTPGAQANQAKRSGK